MPPVESTEHPPALQASLDLDARRKRRLPDQPYANEFYTYYVNDRGVISWSERTSDGGVVQFIRRTGVSMVNPELARQGWALVSDICESDEELATIRRHIDHHAAVIRRGRKDRLIFRVPLSDMPSECLRRQIATKYLRGRATKANADEKEAIRILNGREAAERERDASERLAP